MYGGAELKIAKEYTNEQLNLLSKNGPTRKIAFSGGICSLGLDVIEGQVSACVLTGNTIFNYANNGINYINWILIGTGTTKGVNGIHLLGSSPDANNAKLLTNVKPSTQYTLIYNVKASNLSNSLAVSSQGFTGATVNNIPKTIGVNKVLLTSAVTITNNQLLLVSPSSLSTEYIDFEVYAILEGDWTNKELPFGGAIGYGTKSTLPVKVKSVGKNLFDGLYKKDTYIDVNGNFTTQAGARTTNKIPVITGQSYTISGGNRTTIRIEDSSGNKIFNEQNSISPRTITIPANGRYLYVYYSSDGTHTQVQIEKGTTATANEPYKESVIYTPEIGRSLPNGVKDEVNVNMGVKTKKVSDDVNINNTGWGLSETLTNSYRFGSKNIDAITPNRITDQTSATKFLRIGSQQFSYAFDNTDYEHFYITGTGLISVIINKAKVDAMAGVTVLEKWQSYITQNTATLTYQLATPIESKIPSQPPLKVFPNGPVYAEALGDPAETTLPDVELTVRTGSGNKFGVASHDYLGAAADWVLNTDEQKCLMLTGTNAGGAVNIIALDAPGVLHAVNNLSGQTITIKKSGGTGVAIATGKTAIVMYNGTDYIRLTADV